VHLTFFILFYQHINPLSFLLFSSLSLISSSSFFLSIPSNHIMNQGTLALSIQKNQGKNKK
jgi:hypothetical protein